MLALAAYAVLPLRWRMVGVALAYSVTYLGGLALSTAVLRRRTGGLDGRAVVRHYVRLVVAAVPAAVLGLGGGVGRRTRRSATASAARWWPWRPAGSCCSRCTSAWRGRCTSRS